MTQISDFEKGEIVRAAVADAKNRDSNVPLARAAWGVFKELEERGFAVVQMPAPAKTIEGLYLKTEKGLVGPLRIENTPPDMLTVDFSTKWMAQDDLGSLEIKRDPGEYK